MKRGLRDYSGYVLNIGCLFGSFLLGNCSWEKMTSALGSYFRILRREQTGRRNNSQIYNGKKILTLDEANEYIASKILEGKPFMAGRFGTSEINIMWRARDDGKGFIVPSQRARDVLYTIAGFFPNDKKLMLKFAELMKESTYYADLMGIWYITMEEYELKHYGNNPDFCYIKDLEPFFASKAWTLALEGKKVLIIHPFADTILSQYKKRELLFPGKNILPEFELIMQKAVQTVGDQEDERFHDWFEALEFMYNEAMKVNFDVAILGCGAYGFPLAAKLKRAGKVVIHLGGATQYLFGIKSRYLERLNNDKYNQLMNNEYWVRASEQERPKGFEKVEGGSYW